MGHHELAIDLGGEVVQAGGHTPGLSQAGQAVKGAGGTDEMADLLAEVGCLLEPGSGGGKVAGGSRRPGPGNEQVRPETSRYGSTEGIERFQRLGRLLSPTGHGLSEDGAHIGALSKDRAPQLLVEGVGLAGPTERGQRAALLEAKDREPVGDESSRFGGRVVYDVTVRHGEEFVRLAEPAGVDERGSAVAEQHPLVPRLVGRGDRGCWGVGSTAR